MGKDKHEKEGSKATKFKSDMLLRLRACLMWAENQVCAECSERNPSMASLLMPPTGAYTDIFGITKAEKKKAKKEKKKEGKDKRKMMGVFCCKRCCSDHMLLGREICQVKNIKMIENWTEEAVAAMEMSGNKVVNCIYESNMGIDEKENIDKMTSMKEQQNARTVFISRKYKELDFFGEKMYENYWKSRSNPKRYGTIMAFTATATLLNATKAQRDEIPIQVSVSDPNLPFLGGDSDEEDEPQRSRVGQVLKRNQALKAEDLGYGNADNIDFTNPACLADLGYGFSEPRNNLGYADGTPDSANDVAQELARRSVHSLRRGSVGGRRGSVGGATWSDAIRRGSASATAQDGSLGMVRPQSTGTFLDLSASDKNSTESPHCNRLNARFSSARGKKDGVDGGRSSNSRRSRHGRALGSGVLGANTGSRHARRNLASSPHRRNERRASSVHIRPADGSVDNDGGDVLTAPKVRRQRSGSLDAASISRRLKNGSENDNDEDVAPPKFTRQLSGSDETRSLKDGSNENYAGETFTPAKLRRYRSESLGVVSAAKDGDDGSQKKLPSRTKSCRSHRRNMRGEGATRDSTRSPTWSRQKAGKEDRTTNTNGDRIVRSSHSRSPSKGAGSKCVRALSGDGNEKATEATCKADTEDTASNADESTSKRSSRQRSRSRGPSLSLDGLSSHRRSRSRGTPPKNLRASNTNSDARAQASKHSLKSLMDEDKTFSRRSGAKENLDDDDHSNVSSKSGGKTDYKKKYQGGAFDALATPAAETSLHQAEQKHDESAKTDYKKKYQMGALVNLANSEAARPETSPNHPEEKELAVILGNLFTPSTKDLGYGDNTSPGMQENKGPAPAKELGYGGEYDTVPKTSQDNAKKRQMRRLSDDAATISRPGDSTKHGVDRPKELRRRTMGHGLGSEDGTNPRERKVKENSLYQTGHASLGNIECASRDSSRTRSRLRAQGRCLSPGVEEGQQKSTKKASRSGSSDGLGRRNSPRSRRQDRHGCRSRSGLVNEKAKEKYEEESSSRVSRRVSAADALDKAKEMADIAKTARDQAQQVTVAST